MCWSSLLRNPDMAFFSVRNDFSLEKNSLGIFFLWKKMDLLESHSFFFCNPGPFCLLVEKKPFDWGRYGVKLNVRNLHTAFYLCKKNNI